MSLCQEPGTASNSHQQQGFTHSRLHTGLLPPAKRIHAFTPSHWARAPGSTDSRTHALTPRGGGPTQQQGFTHSRLHTGLLPPAKRIHAFTSSHWARAPQLQGFTHPRSHACGGPTQQQGFTHSRLHTGLLPPAKRIHAFTPSHWARAPGSTDSRTHALTPRGGTDAATGIHALTPSHGPVAASKKDSRIHALTLGTGPGQHGFTHSRPHACGGTTQQQGFTHSRLHTGLLPPAKRIHAFTSSHWARAPQLQGFTHPRSHACGGPTQQQGFTHSRLRTGLLPPAKRIHRAFRFTNSNWAPPVLRNSRSRSRVGTRAPEPHKSRIRLPDPHAPEILCPKPGLPVREDSRKQAGVENLNAREGPGVPGNGKGPTAV